MRDFDQKMRYEYITVEESLPLFVESIGYNPQEQDFVRTGGYPYYHWLQTLEGEGRFSFNGQEYLLSKGRGIFLKPYTPHSYFTSGPKWSTVYVTFGGASAVSILDSLRLNVSSLYTDLSDLPFASVIEEMLIKIDTDSEFSKLDLSAYLYQFLINLRKYGKTHNQPSLSHFYDKVRRLVEWLETVYAEDITLKDMAGRLHVSEQYLNRLFQETFGISPYSFLIRLRIWKAKEMLIQNPDMPLKQLAIRTGFNDVSYFISAFRKREGLTPKKYRLLHVRNSGASGET
ncbi:AraC family transcriptional regulator [Paenibacillus humicola]|uniref:AraC family transcriptional regulator n=1 Tax=Paenibacillus humicola TaxID=3110540 RepID=UPI00237B1F72|nr:AraC family transcriptional regulator [Paenibacillus humicola]